MIPTLVCLRCGRDLHDWQLIAGAQHCAACYQLNVSDDEARKRVQDDAIKDVFSLAVLLMIFMAAAFFLFWYPYPVAQ